MARSARAFVPFDSDGASRCLTFFTHCENLLRVHRYLENASAADNEVARSLPHFPSQLGGHKQRG
jgi:hypothetical protein